MQTEHYLDQAITALRKFDIQVKAETEAPITKLLDLIPARYDSQKILAIGRVLQLQSAFNSIVREQISGMSVAERHATIINEFNSIRDDAQAMAVWVEDGRLDWKERVQNLWMNIRRDSIPQRFEKIKATYLEVAKASADQIERERVILDAYQNYRFALKQAEILSKELNETAEGELARVKAALATASEAASEAALAEGMDASEKARRELDRDKAIVEMQKEDKIYQIIKDLCDNLVIAYNTAEVVFARLQQSTAVKERVYLQSVTFFSTNEIVFTALAASFNSMLGLSESTKTLEAMKDGINKSLETVASLGNAQMEESLRAGYGLTVKAESVRALVDAIVNFQESGTALIEELRKESAANSTEIENIVSDGKRRYTKLLEKTA